MPFPQELITLIVEAYAGLGSRNNLSPLISVSRAFRSPTQKLLFEKVWLAWNVDAEQVLPSPRSDLLVDILSNTPEVIRFIKVLRVCFFSADEDTTNPRGVQCPRVANTLSLLCGAPIEKFELTVSGSSNIKLNLFSPAVMKAIYDIRFNPSLRSMTIEDATNGVPPLLILGRQSDDPLAHLQFVRCTSIFDPDDVVAYRSQHPEDVVLPTLPSLCFEDSTSADFFVLFQSPSGSPPIQTPTPGLALDAFHVSSWKPMNGWFPSLKKFRLQHESFDSDDGVHIFRTLNTLVAAAPLLEKLQLDTYEVENFDHEELKVDYAHLHMLAHLRNVSWRVAEGYALNAIEDLTALIRWLGRLGAPLEKVKFGFHNIFDMDVYHNFGGVLYARFNNCSLRPALETLRNLLREFKSFQRIEITIGSELHYNNTPKAWLNNCPHEACLVERQQFSVRLGEMFAPLTSITPESCLKTEHTYCGHPSVLPQYDDEGGMDSGSD